MTGRPSFPSEPPAGSGRHSCVHTTPGSTSSNPVKNRCTSDRERGAISMPPRLAVPVLPAVCLGLDSWDKWEMAR